MAKIIIKNFRAIDYAEIEIKPFTVIIGEQASGKSTISKLVYFFKSYIDDSIRAHFVCRTQFMEMKDELSKKIFLENFNSIFKELLTLYLRNKFFALFQSTKNEDFEILYWDENGKLLFSINPDNKISIHIQPESLIVSEQEINAAKNSFIRYNDIKLVNDYKKWYNEKITQFNFWGKTLPFIFIPAGRSVLTTITQKFQNKFIGEIEKLDNSSEKNDVFEFVVKSFFEHIDDIKTNYFFGKSLDEVLDEFELKTGKENAQAKLLRDKIKTILKADYQNGSGGEQLFNERFVKPISLDKASSGQQEIVWILLTLLVLQLGEKESFVVIEEPEAHLYPKTQAQVVAYIAQFFNANEKNEIIITTHSPYILTILNNLLLAKQISKKTNGVENQAIAAAIDPHTWLDIDKFSAYYVGRNNEGQFIKSIINPETGLISVNALDDASDDIMDTFDDLMDIYKTTAV